MIKYNSNVVERHNCRKWRPTALKHSNQLVWELALQAAGGEPLRWRAACCFFVHRSIVFKCCAQPRSFDHFHFVLVKLTVSKFCLKETLTPKLNEMFASADYQAAVGFVFGCRRKATPICNSDQAAVGFVSLEFYDHFLGVAAERHLFAIPTRRRSVSVLSVAAKRRENLPLMKGTNHFGFSQIFVKTFSKNCQKSS